MIWIDISILVITVLTFLFLVGSTFYQIRMDKARLKIHLKCFGLYDSHKLLLDCYIYNTGKEALGIKEVSLNWRNIEDTEEWGTISLKTNITLYGRKHIYIRNKEHYLSVLKKYKKVEVRINILDFGNVLYYKRFKVDLIHFKNKERVLSRVYSLDKKVKKIVGDLGEYILNRFE
ncbi:MAG TPA: hypothetical protein VJB89_01745 [Candidatus Nanoarchaeia archaeon]|nr:hypothetical protein [Candidatus Nanoarchaeia archaeon]